MKIIRIYEAQDTEVIGIRCDRCGIDVRTHAGLCEQFALQEFLSIDFFAGYGAYAFEDGTRYQCEICEQCVKDLLGPFLRSYVRQPSDGSDWFDFGL